MSSVTPQQSATRQVPSVARLIPNNTADGRLLDLGAHAQTHGQLPRLTGQQVLDQVVASGLTGRGGAGFPTGSKWEAMARARNPVVVGNGSEGEPLSSKDKVLLTTAPHLVLDGLALAALVIGADEAYLGADEKYAPRLQQLADQRFTSGWDSIHTKIVTTPPGFLTGQETALVNLINGGAALPVATPTYLKGVKGRPTMVQNVETLAHVGLIARYGAGWFRELGTASEPGTMLVSASGALRHPGVLESSIGTPLQDIFDRAGGLIDNPRYVLLSGYHGSWLPLTRHADGSTSAEGIDFSNEALAPNRLGAGIVSVLPEHDCGLVATSQALNYLIAQSARQCGPCLNGLPALAVTFADLIAIDDRSSRRKRRNAKDGWNRVLQLSALVENRGACKHPDGTVRLVRSALTVFSDDLTAHSQGTCLARQTNKHSTGW